MIQNADVQVYAQPRVGYAFTVTVATHELVTGPVGEVHLEVLLVLVGLDVGVGDVVGLVVEVGVPHVDDAVV